MPLFFYVEKSRAVYETVNYLPSSVLVVCFEFKLEKKYIYRKLVREVHETNSLTAWIEETYNIKLLIHPTFAKPVSKLHAEKILFRYR